MAGLSQNPSAAGGEEPSDSEPSNTAEAASRTDPPIRQSAYSADRAIPLPTGCNADNNGTHREQVTGTSARDEEPSISEPSDIATAAGRTEPPGNRALPLPKSCRPALAPAHEGIRRRQESTGGAGDQGAHVQQVLETSACDEEPSLSEPSNIATAASGTEPPGRQSPDSTDRALPPLKSCTPMEAFLRRCASTAGASDEVCAMNLARRQLPTGGLRTTRP